MDLSAKGWEKRVNYPGGIASAPERPKSAWTRAPFPWTIGRPLMTIRTLLAVSLAVASVSMAEGLPSPDTTAAAPSLEQAFAQPARDAQPLVFWMWLGTEMPYETLTRDLEQMKAKGIVGAIIYPSTGGTLWRTESKMVFENKEFKKVPTDDYAGAKAESVPGVKLQIWSPQWRKAVRFAAKESARLGLDLCVAIGTGAPRTVISPADGQKTLEWTTATCDGPGPCDVTLAVPQIKMSAAARDKLTGEPFTQDIAVLAVPDQPTLAPDDVIDVTNKMGTAGRLRWKAPAGKWKLFRFAQVATLKGNAGALQIDGLSAAAMDKAWQGTMKVLLDEMTPDERAGLKFIEEDSWEAGEPDWTQSFAAEFKKRRGYDLIPLLPALAGQAIGGAEGVARIKHDYELTINDLFADNHYGRRRKLANAAGLPFYSEAAGPNMKESDLLRNISKVDVGMAEFWMPSPHRPSPDRRFLVRDAATANHVYGKSVTPCEAFTSVGPHWEESLFDLKACADQAFCDGMNRIVFHNFGQSASMTAKPGYTMWAGTHYEPGATWWEQTPAFNAYLARCSSLLQQGLFTADALMYQGDPFGYGGHAMKKVLPTLGEGYDSDDCNTDVLLHRTGFKDGRVVLPDGMGYHVLVLPDGQPIRLDALRQVASLLEQGATVVGPKPTGMADYSGDANAAKAFDELASRLWTNAPSGDQRINAGRLVWGKTARQVLQEGGVAPDVEYTGLSKDGTVDWIHRTADGAEVYYVTSRWFTPEKIDCTFRVSGKQPELWDPVTGRTRDAVSFRQADGRTTVPLEFGPSGSTFVVFRKPIAVSVQGAASTNEPTTQLIKQLDGPWQVAFDPKWGGPASVQFDSLVDWTKRPETGIHFYSGKATYHQSFDLPAATDGRTMMLDLGQVHEVASVRLNGHALGVVWNKPAIVDITSAVRAGVNTLEIDVVNLWPNRLIGDASLPPEQRLTVTNMRKFTPKTPLLPSGLLGPVQILEQKAP